MDSQPGEKREKDNQEGKGEDLEVNIFTGRRPQGGVGG